MTRHEADALQAGDAVVCTRLDKFSVQRNITTDHGFTIGKIYTVGGYFFERNKIRNPASYLHGRIYIVADDRGEPNGWTADYFERVLPDFKEVHKISDLINEKIKGLNK